MNRIFLAGNLGVDPQLKVTNSDKEVCNFTLATKGWRKSDDGNNDTTTWHSVTAWGSQAKYASNYLKKGDECLVEGRVEHQSYTDQNGVKKNKTIVVANSVKGFKRKGASSEKALEVSEDDIPF